MKTWHIGLCLIALSGGLYAQSVRPVQRIDNPAGSRNPDADGLTLQADGDLVVAMWLDERELTHVDDEIFMKVSQDGGLSWGPEWKVTDFGSDNVDANPSSLVVSDGIIHITSTNTARIWDDPECVYYRSDDLGATWSTRLISNEYSGPRVAADGQNVGLVWESKKPGVNFYYSCWSQDGGETFEPQQTVDANGRNPDDNFDIEVDGDIMRVLFVDERWISTELRYASSVAGGPWSPSLVIDQGAVGVSDIEWQIDLAGSGSHWQATWLEEDRGGTSKDHLYVRRSRDGGLTWDAETQISPLGYVGVSRFGADIDGERGIVCWIDDEAGSQDQPVKVSTTLDAGLTWSASIALPGLHPGSFRALHCRPFVSDNMYFVGFRDFSGPDSTPAFCWSNDQGSTWNGPISLNPEDIGQGAMDLEATSFWADGGSFLAAWKRQATPDPPGIYLSGARAPFLTADLQARVLTLDTFGAAPSSAQLPVYCAVSSGTSLRAVALRQAPGLFLDLIPGAMFQKSQLPMWGLNGVLSAQGEASLQLTLPLGIPDITYYWQSWVLDSSLPLGGAVSDVFPLSR